MQELWVNCAFVSIIIIKSTEFDFTYWLSAKIYGGTGASYSKGKRAISNSGAAVMSNIEERSLMVEIFPLSYTSIIFLKKFRTNVN